MILFQPVVGILAVAMPHTGAQDRPDRSGITVQRARAIVTDARALPSRRGDDRSKLRECWVARVSRWKMLAIIPCINTGTKATSMILGVPPRPGPRIMLASSPVDFRKGLDSLAALVTQALASDLYTGDVFIFRSKRLAALRG